MRSIKEPTNLRRQFMVHTYRGVGSVNYFFTVEGNKLFRIEADLQNVDWTVARDMGTQRVVTEIDPEILEVWQTENEWTDITVIRPGIARKFQALALVRGNTDVSDENGPAWNAGAYLPTTDTSIYNYAKNTVNDMLVLGHEGTTVSTPYTENLPFGTFWALNDPMVIQYTLSGAVYRRAIKHRIDETTQF